MLGWLRRIRVWVEPVETGPDDTRPIWRRLAYFIGFKKEW